VVGGNEDLTLIQVIDQRDGLSLSQFPSFHYGDAHLHLRQVQVSRGEGIKSVSFRGNRQVEFPKKIMCEKHSHLISFPEREEGFVG
jgi:hypothetical protein